MTEIDHINLGVSMSSELQNRNNDIRFRRKKLIGNH